MLHLVFTSAIGLCWLCAAFGTTPVCEIVKKRIRIDLTAQTAKPVPATNSSFLSALQAIDGEVRSGLAGDCNFFSVFPAVCIPHVYIWMCFGGKTVVSRVLYVATAGQLLRTRHFISFANRELLGLLRWHRWQTANIAGCGLTGPVHMLVTM